MSGHRSSGARARGAKHWALVAAAAAFVAQWMVFRALGLRASQPWDVILPGLAIFGAAFLLTWAAEAAEKDIPQNIAIGILALIAVLPEYAVDIYFAWTAGKDPSYTAYATANMTGANRLLIGIGWPAVLLACWLKRGQRSIRLAEHNAPELVALLAATAYSLVLPLKGTLSLVDCAFFIGIFAAYAFLCAKAPVSEPELEGPAEVIGELPAPRRRAMVAGLFLFSAAAICLSAEPFAEGILHLGRRWGIEEFILVQWLAPLASEAPEFIVAILFAMKGKADVGLRALVSSKVNQWTLLVGMLPAAYSLSAGHLGGMRLDARQTEEILLTSAQSLFGLVLLMNLEFTLTEALMLGALFVTQMFFPQTAVRYAFAALYLVLSAAMLAAQSGRSRGLSGLLRHALEIARS